MGYADMQIKEECLKKPNSIQVFELENTFIREFEFTFALYCIAVAAH